MCFTGKKSVTLELKHGLNGDSATSAGDGALPEAVDQTLANNSRQSRIGGPIKQRARPSKRKAMASSPTDTYRYGILKSRRHFGDLYH